MDVAAKHIFAHSNTMDPTYNAVDASKRFLHHRSVGNIVAHLFKENRLSELMIDRKESAHSGLQLVNISG